MSTSSVATPSRRSAHLLLVALITVGCSSDDRWKKDRPPVYPTTGTVLVDGRPMAGVTVMFQPVDEVAGKPGTAITDGDGEFSVQTFEPGDGLTEGTHRVSLRKTVMLDRQGNELKEIREPGDAKETHLIPKKYQEFKTSGLEIQVKPEDSNQLATFEVSSK